MGARSPRGGDGEPSGGKKGVKSQRARHVLPSPEFRTPPAMKAPPASAQSVNPCCGITRKAERGAGAFRTKASRPEMVARSAGGEGTRIDGRRIGNGRAGQSAQERPGRDFRRHGKEEPTKNENPRAREEGVRPQAEKWRHTAAPTKTWREKTIPK